MAKPRDSMNGSADRAAHLRSGRAAETRACRHLQKLGLQLMESNFRCAAGELDLIMRDGDTLVFVEVRYRRRADYGQGFETVDARKQGRLIRAAQTWLTRHGHHNKPCRFDVLSIGPGSDEHGIQWIPDAFEVE